MPRETQCELLDLRPEAAREFAACDPLDRLAHALHAAHPRGCGRSTRFREVRWIDGEAIDGLSETVARGHRSRIDRASHRIGKDRRARRRPVTSALARGLLLFPASVLTSSAFGIERNK
jgi:hypothetical protein